MRRFFSLVLALFSFVLVAVAQPQTPFTTDSSTVALWHLDELSGSQILDKTGYHNGTAFGTTVVQGHFGLARKFNGQGDYVYVPSDPSLNLGDSSFTVELWFQTTADSGYLIRRGMAPTPGFNMLTNAGRLACQIGNSFGQTPENTIISIVTTKKVNDGQWHFAKMVRDRHQKTLSLYCDGILVAGPAYDDISFPLDSDRPLTIGCWENMVFPEFFDGSIDEVRISSAMKHLSSSSVVEGNPLLPDSATVALWHFNEASGNDVIDTLLLNNGMAVGTAIIPGRFGNARRFNGMGDFIQVPSGPWLDLGDSSFSVELWFQTTADSGYLIRRGMAPTPGFNMLTNAGRLGCQIGNSVGSSRKDTILSIISTKKFNDGKWHYAQMVRDRAVKTLSLFCDSVLVAPPVNDSLAFPLDSDRPLTIGCWENFVFPEFFAGAIDEVRLRTIPSRRLRPVIAPRSRQMSFGLVFPGSRDTLRLTIFNRGLRDTLHIGQISVPDTQFGVSISHTVIPPGDSTIVTVVISPVGYHFIQSTLYVPNDDPLSPLLAIDLRAQSGYTEVAPASPVGVPTRFVLEQNFPNPFNPTTVVSCQLPVASDVTLAIYDVLGREVAVLLNGRKDAGTYQVTFNAAGLATGTYFYRLEAAGFVQTRKMILMR